MPHSDLRRHYDLPAELLNVSDEFQPASFALDSCSELVPLLLVVALPPVGLPSQQSVSFALDGIVQTFYRPPLGD